MCAVQDADRCGGGGEDFATAMRRVRATVDHVAATEDEATLRAEGIEVVRGHAMFLSPDAIEVKGASCPPTAWSWPPEGRPWSRTSPGWRTWIR
ncbi:hypothetical protein [Nocardiopsis lucentensis]|uniref:hypothetical protein n=1 Tax=Nocardiopsis lucentensis TaxID=53441 RepID=UPI00034B5A30|nr:hypothetical protein [Nocardiopsis lucentensis]